MSTSAPHDDPNTAAAHVGLLDDASLLQAPSGAGAASLADVVARFGGRRTRLVGSLVVPDPVLPALAAAPAPDGATVAEPLPLTLAVTGGAGGVEPAVRWAGQCAGATVRTVSTALRDLDDLAGAARRTVAAAEPVADVLPDARVSVGLPLDGVGRPGWLAALDEVAMADLAVSFATGGLAPAAPGAVVAAVDAALDREVPLRFTGPTRHVAPRALLLVVRLVLDGEQDAAASVLGAGEDVLTAREADVGDDALVRARRWLLSVEAVPPAAR